MGERERDQVVKARLVGLDVPRSRGGGEATYKQVFEQAGAIEPPLDPLVLCSWFEMSSALRPNIDAYATNIDGYGHRLDPAIDLDADDADTQIADAIFLRRISEDDGADEEEDDALEPTKAEVAKERLRLRRLARREKARLEAFFEHACAETSFVRLRRRLRQDLEVTGNAYMEVLRNRRGEIARFVYVPSYLVRLMTLDSEPTAVREWERVSPVDYRETFVDRQLRRLVQVDECAMTPTYFRELGDPRVVSSVSGGYYENAAALRAAEGDALPATEMIHLKIDSPSSPYGLPRWAGAYPEVAGARATSEVNFLFFDNKSIPPMALFVSGGTLSEGAVARLEKHIPEAVHGRSNFDKLLILEADSKRTSGITPKIELHPLMQVTEGRFQGYDERCIDKVGAQFRVPRIVRGDTKDFNRATANAALRFVEDQVFGPERDDFDWFVRRRILPELRVRFWRFRSLSPVTRDPDRLAVMTEKLVRVGVLTPQEGRHLAADIFNTHFPDINQPWARRPIPLTLAGINMGTEPDDGRPGPLEEAKSLLSIQERLEAEKAALAARRMALARAAASGAEPDIIKVPADEFESWFTPEGDGE